MNRYFRFPRRALRKEALEFISGLRYLRSRSGFRSLVSRKLKRRWSFLELKDPLIYITNSIAVRFIWRRFSRSYIRRWIAA